MLKSSTRTRHESELARLRFEPILEREFLHVYFSSSMNYARAAIALCIVGYLVFLAFDRRPDEASQAEQSALRVFGVVSLLILLGTSYTRLMPRFYEVLMVGVFLINGFSIVAISRFNVDPVRATLLFLMLSISVGYTLSRVRTWVAAASCLAVTGNYVYAALTHAPHLRPSLPETMLTLVMANVLGAAAAYMLERSVRTDFILKRELDAERERADSLLRNMLPEAVAEKLKRHPGVHAEKHDEVTVLFADLVDFTPMSADSQPEEVVELLNRVFSRFDSLAAQHGVEKIKTIGDAYMAVSGLPYPRRDHASAAMALAVDMMRAVQELDKRLRLRVGLNSGPVVAGVIGVQKLHYDLWGDTVNVASRMQSHGVADAIQVTKATYEFVGGQYVFDQRGDIEIKGRGLMPVYVHSPAVGVAGAE